ncbi:MAG TPA: Tex family protein [Alphaproteobacteria bacterium]|nr:Tex family protein [Alphaproteobacteria bacterium]
MTSASDAIVQAIAASLQLKALQVTHTVDLLASGNTVPFIARYRKERTGGLHEEHIRAIQERYTYAIELEARKTTILEAIDAAGKLTDALHERIVHCTSKQELEDLYLPYRPKRRTKASMARDKGLEPLANAILADARLADLDAAARPYVNPELGVATPQEALEGAGHIIAERIADDADIRQWVRKRLWEQGTLITKRKKGAVDPVGKYADYYDFSQAISKLPSHQILALNRAEREGVIAVTLEAPIAEALAFIQRRIAPQPSPAVSTLLRTVCQDAYERLLHPSLTSEVRADLTAQAGEVAIAIFAKNLRTILMAPPLKGKVVLGIDPGLRTGSKLAVLDATGKLLAHATIYPHPPRQDVTGAAHTMLALIAQHRVEVLAIGNGTGRREVEQFLTAHVLPYAPHVQREIVDEDGASVYSASRLAQAEFPDLDVTVRGAISIARRLQDPLAELVKIEPQALGVGQYQHDVDAKRLQTALDQVVESCVNSVGVDVNTASAMLLRYVSGIGPTLAHNIVAYRDRHGPFRSRMQLLDVPKLGEKAFQQAAGFLRVPDSADPLDNSWVHPEQYDLVARMARTLGVSVAELMGHPDRLAHLEARAFVDEEAGVGVATVQDILEELQKPGRDPRAATEYFAYHPDVADITDLKPGMVLAGKVTNITAFGAFVDIGVHRDGLVHISELAPTFVKDPHSVVAINATVRVKVLAIDVARQRISLSIRQAGASAG